MSQLRHQQERLDELKINVKIVAFDDEFMAKAYTQQTDLLWPILLDHDRKLYAAYGMEKGTWWDIYNPVSIVRYIGLLLRGRSIGKPGSDWFQMGGDVLIDPNDIVRLQHVSTNPHDRPSVRAVLDTVAHST